MDYVTRYVRPVERHDKTIEDTDRSDKATSVSRQAHRPKIIGEDRVERTCQSLIRRGETAENRNETRGHDTHTAGRGS